MDKSVPNLNIILFTDDDDLWNTDRVEKYIKCDLKKQQIFCISHTITSDNIYIQDIIQDKNTHKSEPCEYFNYCLPAKLCLKIINTESHDFLYYHRMYFNFDKWCN